MDAAIALQWLALCFIFLTGSIWSEDNARFGYVITALMGGFFWWIGWITFAYLGTVIPVVIMIAILSYLRSHLKYKFGVFGSNGGLLWKVLGFIIVLQFAIITINGLAIFNGQWIANPSNEFTGYTIDTAESTFGGFTTGVAGADAVIMALTIGWLLLGFLWSMLVAFFTLYPTLVSTFHVPVMIAAAISCGVYVLTALELFVLIFKPIRPVEV